MSAQVEALAAAVASWHEEQAAPAAAEESDTRFTLTYRDHGREITVDLDEVPDEALPERVRRWRPAQTYAAVEDIREMARNGETLAGVAERLTRLRGKNVSAPAVERLLHRYGAHDVVWQLKANARDIEAPTPDSPDWYLAGTVGPCRSNLPPDELDAARRKWNEGPEEALGEMRSRYDVIPTSPHARLRSGRPVRGRRL